MMILPVVVCAAGHGCNVVCVICMLTVVVYTWLGVLAGGGETQIDRKYNLIRTIDAKVLNLNGPNIFVQNGDAAHSSSK